MRRAARVDRNQAEIVRVLRAIGASVQHLHSVGKGCPDLLVGYQGINYLFEIKDGTKPRSQRKLTPDEVEFFMSWRGRAYIVDSVHQALVILGVEADAERLALAA